MSELTREQIEATRKYIVDCASDPRDIAALNQIFDLAQKGRSLAAPSDFVPFDTPIEDLVSEQRFAITAHKPEFIYSMGRSHKPTPGVPAGVEQRVYDLAKRIFDYPRGHKVNAIAGLILEEIAGVRYDPPQPLPIAPAPVAQACSSYFPDEVTDRCTRCGQSQYAHANPVPAAPKPVAQEAVAWRYRYKNGEKGDWLFTDVAPNILATAYETEPLYAAPVSPVPEGEPHPEAAHLECVAEGGVISMRIGVKTLAHATEICPELWDAEKDRGSYKVIDPEVFAKEVADKINDEDEQGNTLLTRMLDKAIADAINWGCEGIEENLGSDINGDRAAERKDG